MPDPRDAPPVQPSPEELEEIKAILELLLDMDELAALPLEDAAAEEGDDEP